MKQIIFSFLLFTLTNNVIGSIYPEIDIANCKSVGKFYRCGNYFVTPTEYQNATVTNGSSLNSRALGAVLTSRVELQKPINACLLYHAIFEDILELIETRKAFKQVRLKAGSCIEEMKNLRHTAPSKRGLTDLQYVPIVGSRKLYSQDAYILLRAGVVDVT